MVERTVSERQIHQGNPSMIRKSVIASPDCRRLSYVTRAGGKRFVDEPPALGGEDRYPQPLTYVAGGVGT